MSSDDAADSRTLPLPPTSAPGERPHVYVINSDAAFLDMIAELLADVRMYVTVEQARPNVEVTLDNLRSARPDLLILDVRPLYSEAENLLDALENAPDLARLPVLAASTNHDLAERAAQAHPGLVRAILPKPFDLDDFYAAVLSLMAVVRAGG